MQLHKHNFVRAITAFSLAILLFIHAGAVSAQTVNAGSISDLKAQLSALEKEEEETKDLLSELREDTEQKRVCRDALKDKIAQVQQFGILKQSVEELSAMYAESELLLLEAEESEAEAQADADRIAHEKEETGAAIDKWYEEYYAALEAANSNASYTGAGNFVWPMPGYTYITCDFGDGHRGIDIAGNGIYGKPIVAADGGTVIYSGWLGSYGYCVFIDHGNGYSTRYAHASALACSVGDVVVPGQMIAYVGSTGNSTGPHLHFEVISNGSLQSPFNYF